MLQYSPHVNIWNLLHCIGINMNIAGSKNKKHLGGSIVAVILTAKCFLYWLY